MTSRRTPIIRVLGAGAALTLGLTTAAAPMASASGPPDDDDGPPSPVHHNPPAPPPTADTTLPTWDEVTSSHPKGATNPPRPVFEVTADGARCFKHWAPGMRAPDRQERAYGGRVLKDASEAKGVEVQCDADRARKVLEAKRKADAGD
ncbi:MAG: hypothetical protein ACON4N_07280 [Myxococcota bacterium]